MRKRPLFVQALTKKVVVDRHLPDICEKSIPSKEYTLSAARNFLDSHPVTSDTDKMFKKAVESSFHRDPCGEICLHNYVIQSSICDMAEEKNLPTFLFLLKYEVRADCQLENCHEVMCGRKILMK